MRRTSALVALAATATLTTAVLTAATGGAAGASAQHRAVAKGGPGSWTKISKSGVDAIKQASMIRTADGVLHVVYARDLSSLATTISHVALDANGAIVRQNDVLANGWAAMDLTPTVINGASGMHTVFGGQEHSSFLDYFDDGRMYMADANSDAGSSWSLPQQAVGLNHFALDSYGTGAVELGDGTPVAAFALNQQLIWHIGTSEVDADRTYTAPPGTSVYDATLVRDGNAVWAAWFELNSGTAFNNGFFARRIYPSVGPVLKAPGSSKGKDVIPWQTRTAMTTRVGGGIYLAYCVGYPTCTKVRIWKVGTSATADVPGSRDAASIGLSSGPSGRLWVAWASSLTKVRALRTGVNGLAMGAVRKLGLPTGHPSVYNIAIEGSRGRGDIVVNVGDGFWHTQVLPGLTLHANPSTWRHGSRQKVVFTVTDAHSAVGGATVKVGTLHCSTGTQGTCSITFPRSYPTGKHTATAVRSGYAKATITLRVS